MPADSRTKTTIIKLRNTFEKYIINDEIKKKQHINEKKDLPAGNITNFLLKKYLIGISATLLRKKIFDNLEFNSEYQIIGDFDFFLRLTDILGYQQDLC